MVTNEQIQELTKFIETGNKFELSYPEDIEYGLQNTAIVRVIVGELKTVAPNGELMELVVTCTASACERTRSLSGEYTRITNKLADKSAYLYFGTTAIDVYKDLSATYSPTVEDIYKFPAMCVPYWEDGDKNNRDNEVRRSLYKHKQLI